MNFGSLPRHLTEQIDRARDDFEAAWNASQQPKIEEFLQRVPESARSALLRALIATELEFRQAGSESPTLDEYLVRFPAETEVVRSAFAGTDQRVTRSAISRTSILSTVAGESGVKPVQITTFPWNAEPSSNHDFELAWPERIGAYRPSRLLGEGGFGRVYYAWHQDLNRAVAIKVARVGMLGSPEREEMLLDEARLAASLKHPGIVTVYDLGRLEGGRPFVVLEFIEGQSLEMLLRAERLAPDRLARLLARVAEATHHAHRAGLVHRDLKPSNILIDARGEPHITDFGLAVNEDLQRRRSGEVAGTPAYMAPEQVRGETHRLDGRTDIWALGVILYQGLVDHAPFRGRNREELYDEILNREPRPPRQLDERVPRELERICLACLNKRMTDRYGSAIDLAQDLQAWLETQYSPTPAAPRNENAPRFDVDTPNITTPIVPKGLRAFDKEDAGFFLSLLPGSRGRDGLPESIRFWKNRIEDRDGDTAFSVGLLYGPSGGGKSSLVKAGLLPRLNSSVLTVYVEASPGRTEGQLLATLRRRFPRLPQGCNLAEALAAIREADLIPTGGKLLLMLDQFEQWLQAHQNEPRADLVQALRQCDGRRLQAMLLVRDDFWMAVTRLFKALEVPLVEGGNSAPVEMFDAGHARKVVIEFGRACGQLGDGPRNLGAEAESFVDRAVGEMTGPDGRITPVRLALFAEMVRRRPWTPATLRLLGGVEGIGVRFLEEAFDAASAPPSYRLHRRGAQAVLQALLPAPTSVLRGSVRSGRELQEAAGYVDRPDDFADLMRILDNDLRMVTSMDPDGTDEVEREPRLDRSEIYYQLAHDFLVGSIRQWVERKQRATRPGRARLRLAIITAAWVERPSPHRLPSLLEWAGIVWHTRPGSWLADERRMIRAATRHYAASALVAAGLAVAAFLAFKTVRDNERASAVLLRALKADYRNLSSLFPELGTYRSRIQPELERLERDPTAAPRDRDVAILLLHRDRPTPGRAQALRARLNDGNPDEVSLIGDALAAHPAAAGAGELRQSLLNEDETLGARLRAACVLARLKPVDAAAWSPAAIPLTHALLAEDRRSIPRWLELLGPAVPVLVPPLRRICADKESNSTRRASAAEALAEAFAMRRDSEGLARSLVEARPEASLILLRELERLESRGPAVNYLRGVLAKTPSDRADEVFIEHQAGAAIALAYLGEPEDLQPVLRHRPDPRLRTRTIANIARSGLAPRVLFNQFDWSVLDEGERQAILLAWAETPAEGLRPSVRAEVLKTARGLYVGDPDPGVHSAAELLLRRWDRPSFLELSARLRRPLGAEVPGGRTWTTGPNGHTLVMIAGPSIFRMGSPEGEPDRFPYETQHYRRIKRSLAVSATEVTDGQYRAFRTNYRPDPRYNKQAGGPAGGISWYEALRYCNWLSKQAGIAPDQWCYPADEEIKRGMKLPPDAFERTGFRLPTEAEWEFLCRAGTETCRPFGESDEFLNRYAWTALNSREHSAPAGSLLPNPFGLFDTIGSQWEWCHDGPQGGDYYPKYPKGSEDHPADDPFLGVPVNTEDWRLVRGGTFDVGPSTARAAHRDIFRADSSRYFNGFRVIRTLAETSDQP